MTECARDRILRGVRPGDAFESLWRWQEDWDLRERSEPAGETVDDDEMELERALERAGCEDVEVAILLELAYRMSRQPSSPVAVSDDFACFVVRWASRTSRSTGSSPAPDRRWSPLTATVGGWPGRRRPGCRSEPASTRCRRLPGDGSKSSSPARRRTSEAPIAFRAGALIAAVDAYEQRGWLRYPDPDPVW